MAGCLPPAQIRVHLAHAGHAILGDDLYGVTGACSQQRLAPALQPQPLTACGLPAAARTALTAWPLPQLPGGPPCEAWSRLRALLARSAGRCARLAADPAAAPLSAGRARCRTMDWPARPARRGHHDHSPPQRAAPHRPLPRPARLPARHGAAGAAACARRRVWPSRGRGRQRCASGGDRAGNGGRILRAGGASGSSRERPLAPPALALNLGSARSDVRLCGVCVWLGGWGRGAAMAGRTKRRSVAGSCEGWAVLLRAIARRGWHETCQCAAGWHAVHLHAAQPASSFTLCAEVCSSRLPDLNVAGLENCNI